MTAYIFIPIFIVIIVAFGFFIGYVSKRLSGNIRLRPYNVATGLVIALILLGVVGMFQPWTIEWYQAGFRMVLIGTLAFTVWSHVRPRAAES